MYLYQALAEAAHLDDSMINYDYDNVNDRDNFCPVVDVGCVDDDDDDDIEFNFAQEPNPAEGGYEDNNFGGGGDATSTNLDDSLVEQPKKVNKIDIGYAKTAKKMDIKRLKASMWSILNKPDSASWPGYNIFKDQALAAGLIFKIRPSLALGEFGMLIRPSPSKKF